jgi:hypothetical protein
MSKNNPCFTCGGGIDCAACLNSPLNSAPVKLYTPKGAARAMLAGKVLNGEGGRTCYFDKDGFFFNIPNRFRIPLTGFSGLWEEPA